MLDDPDWVEPWTPPPGDGALVLAAMSSTFQDHADSLQRAAAALGTLPVRGLVTTGPSIDPSAIEAPPNVTVVASARTASIQSASAPDARASMVRPRKAGPTRHHAAVVASKARSCTAAG